MIRVFLVQVINSLIGYYRRKKTAPETITTADEAIDILELGWLTKKEYYACASYMSKVELSDKEENDKFSSSEIVEIIVHEPWYDDWLELGKPD